MALYLGVATIALFKLRVAIALFYNTLEHKRALSHCYSQNSAVLCQKMYLLSQNGFKKGYFSHYFAFLYFYRKMDIGRVAIHAILRFCTFSKLSPYRGVLFALFCVSLLLINKIEPIEWCYSRYFVFLYCYRKMF